MILIPFSLKCLIPDIQPRNDFVEPPKNLYDNNLSRVALSRGKACLLDKKTINVYSIVQVLNTHCKVEKEKNISDITEQMKVLPPPNLADESSQDSFQDHDDWSANQRASII